MASSSPFDGHPRPHAPQDISAFEAVKLDDLDAEAVKTQYSAAASAFGSAAEGSAEKAAAGVQMDTAKAMGDALGVAL